MTVEGRKMGWKYIFEERGKWWTWFLQLLTLSVRKLSKEESLFWEKSSDVAILELTPVF